MSLRLPVLISGDSRTLVLPATNPQTGLPITIPGTATLIFSAKRSKYAPDTEAVFQKVTGAGITFAGSTITVVLVSQDTLPLLEYADLFCDVQAQDVSFGILTIWEGVLPVRLGVTQGTSTSVPVFTLDPPIPGTGSGDMLESVYDPDADGKVVSAASADVAPWDGITGKPGTFPPAGHTHPLSDIAQSGATNGQVPTWTGSEYVPQTPEAGGGGGGGDMFKSTYDPDLDGKVVSAVAADSVPYTGVTGKPATFPAAAHTHAESEVVGLVADLAAKSDVGHTHTAAAVGADPTGTAAAAVTAHEAAGDPHPQYTTGAEVVTAITGKADSATLVAHVADVANPHATTKAQVGLGSADNTTDLGKPISTLTQAALDAKAASVHVHATSDITGFTAAASAAAPVQSVAALTGAITAAALRTGLGLVVGTDVQAFDSDLAAIAALTTTPFGRGLLTEASAITARATLGAGTSSFSGAFSALSGIPTTLGGFGITDAQPLDSDLTAIAALTTTSFGRSLLTQADATAVRTLIGAGTSSFAGTFAALTGKPTTISGYGLTDAVANGLATASGLTLNTARILGRTTAATGAIEELSVGSSLSLAAGVLNTIQGIRVTDTPTFAGLASTGNVGITATRPFIVFTYGANNVTRLGTATPTGSHWTQNLGFDGTSWVRDDITQPGAVMGLNSAGALSIRTTPIGANPASLTSVLTFDGTSLGIGVSPNPAYKLDVGGSTVIRGDVFITKGSSPFFGCTDNFPLRLGVNSAEYMRIDTSGNVGIGASTTSARLNVMGSINFGPADGSMVAVGTSTTFTPSGGLPTAHYGMTFGGFTTNSLSLSGYNGIALYTGGGIERMKIDASGNVSFPGSIGIGTTIDPSLKLLIRSLGSTNGTYGLVVANSAGAWNFTVRDDGSATVQNFNNFTTANAANAYFDGGGTLYKSTSSERYKKNIVTYARGLADLLKLRPVSFEGISEVDTGKTFAGLTAEEVHSAGLTEYVTYDKHGRPDALHYSQMVALLINSIKEMSARILTLEACAT